MEPGKTGSYFTLYSQIEGGAYQGHNALFGQKNIRSLQRQPGVLEDVLRELTRSVTQYGYQSDPVANHGTATNKNKNTSNFPRSYKNDFKEHDIIPGKGWAKQELEDRARVRNANEHVQWAVGQNLEKLIWLMHSASNFHSSDQAPSRHPVPSSCYTSMGIRRMVRRQVEPAVQAAHIQPDNHTDLLFCFTLLIQLEIALMFDWIESKQLAR